MEAKLPQSHVVSPVANCEKTPRYAWVILVVTYLASLTAPLGQFKVTAVAGDIIAAFSLSYAEFGMLMTCLAIIGALLAFPGAFVCRRIGLKATCMIAMLCVIAGGIIEVATSEVALLYLGRFVEGFGIGFIGVAAPTIISLWFPEKTRGLALGTWCTWVPMAIAIDFNAGPAIAAAFGWQAVFYAVIGVTVIALLLFAAFYRLPEGSHASYAVEGSFKDCFKHLKNRYIWLLGITFLVYNFVQGGVVNTYYPAFLAEQGFDAATCGFMTSIITIIGFIMNPVSGAISDHLRVNRRYTLITLFAVMYLVCFLVGFPESTENGGMIGIWAFIILMGFAAAFGGGGSRPLAPTIMNGSAMAATMGMSVMQFSQCLGQAMAPLYGSCIDAGMGWMGAAWATVIPLSIVALAVSFFIKPEKKKTLENNR